MKNSAIDYSVVNEGNKITIKAEGKVPTTNKIMLGGFLVFFVIYSYFQFGTKPNIPWWVFPFVLLIGAIGGGIGLLMARGIRKNLGIRTIVIDKDNKILSSPHDGISVKFSDIKDVVIAEKFALVGSVSLLKLQLVDGEKTLTFPFPTYNKAQEVLNTIKTNIK
jgi:hypothetical protein